MISSVTQMEIIWKIYTLGMLTYPLTNLGFKKLLEFSNLGSYLWYIIYEGMLYSLLTILITSNMFLMVSWATQTKIICKHYALGKLKYQLTTCRLTKLLAFDLIGFCLGYTITIGMFYSLPLLYSSMIPFQWYLTYSNIDHLQKS